MANLKYRDQSRRNLVKKYELKRLIYKSLFSNQTLPVPIRKKAEFALQSLPRNSSKIRVQNRCIRTGRAKAVYRKFRLSRICFRELAAFGALPGVYKASW